LNIDLRPSTRIRVITFPPFHRLIESKHKRYIVPIAIPREVSVEDVWQWQSKVGHHRAALWSRQVAHWGHGSLYHQASVHRHVHQQCERQAVEGAVRHVDQRLCK